MRFSLWTRLAWCMLCLGGCDPLGDCASLEQRGAAALPARLSETGLFKAGSQTLARNVRAYTPRFELWSDGASKRRWLSLPEGAWIDTSDPDDWQFPEGTKLWKEFTREGVRIETRLLQKTSAMSWSAMSYVWRADQRDADAQPAGLQDALGTPHDVPAASDCWACHGGRRSFVLGVSYVQLGYDADPSQLDVATLANAGLLSPPLAVDVALPGTSIDQAALGYLHANCGHCHNGRRPRRVGPRCYDPENNLDFWLRHDRLESVGDTPTLRTSARKLRPGHPDDSQVIELMSRRRGDLWMPPLASELPDHAAIDTVRAFIEAL